MGMARPSLPALCLLSTVMRGNGRSLTLADAYLDRLGAQLTSPELLKGERMRKAAAKGQKLDGGPTK